MGESKQPFGALEFERGTGVIGEMRLFDTREERDAWVGEHAEHRQARFGYKVRWLIEARGRGEEIWPVLRHHGRLVTGLGKPTRETLTPQEWTRLVESTRFVHETLGELLGKDDAAMVVLNDALREAFEAVESLFEQRQAAARPEDT